MERQTIIIEVKMQVGGWSAALWRNGVGGRLIHTTHGKTARQAASRARRWAKAALGYRPTFVL